MSSVYYICDRKACGSECHDECMHTRKAKHAKNFCKVQTKSKDVYYIERKRSESIIDYKFKRCQKLYFIVRNDLGKYSIFSTIKWKHAIDYEEDQVTPKIILKITDLAFNASKFSFNGKLGAAFDNEKDAVKCLLKLPHENIFIEEI